MKRLVTVLLHHEQRTGSHYDWLLVSPNPSAAGLTTFRIAPCSAEWEDRAVFSMQQLPDHRMVYLSYEGPISRDRGRVRRVDQGTHLPRLWSDSRIITEVALRHWNGRVDLRRTDGSNWQASLFREPV